MGCGPSTHTLSMIDRVMFFHSATQFRAHLKASRSSSKLMVIEFSATRRRPSRFMEPVVAELAERYPEIQFVKIDVDDLPGVGRDFGIQAMPTFVLLRGRKEVERVVGANNDELRWKIDKHRSLY